MNPPVYKTIEDMFRQIEFCGYECEAGKLEMNVAYIQLKESLRWHNAVKDPPKEGGEYWAQPTTLDGRCVMCYYDKKMGWRYLFGTDIIYCNVIQYLEKMPEPPKEEE